MLCEGEIIFNLTKKINKKIISELEKVIQEYNKKKGEKTKNNYDNSKIIIKIKSERQTLTDYVLPLEKELKNFLGRNYKIGINKMEVKDYKINFVIDKKALENPKIPFIDKLKINDKKAMIYYKKISEDFIKNNNVERTIKLVNEKIKKQYYEGKGEHHEILYTSPKREPVWKKNPTEEMIKNNWIMPGPTKGKWLYRPQATAVIKAMEEIVINEILKPLGFVEIINSNIISGEEIWEKTGHLAGMPMELYYVVEPISRNPKEWEEFIDELKITKKIPYNKFQELIKIKPLQGLTYAQCPIIYWSLKGKVIKDSTLPLKIFERKANSFRYESGGRHGIERVDEFHRIEIVYIGTKKQLLELREKINEKYKKIFNEILEIEWRTAWVTPFYLQQAGEIKEDFKDKIYGTMDYEAWLPYRGSREKSEWLEFQNVSIVGDKYVEAFNIKGQKEKLISGCSGVGLERWIAVFLAQKGLDPKKWPKGFKKYLPKLPKGFEFL